MAFPEGLPTQFKYKSAEFYVRECYPTYYNEIIRLLYQKDMDVVTVTGTPGIGKSMFYAYFLVCYMKEYPDTTVVTAAFKRQHMTKVAVWKNGEKSPTKSTSDTTKLDMETFVIDANKAAKKQVIHLYDGAPLSAPEDVKMVCFTSPTKEWLDAPENKKDTNHATLFMPLWHVDELRDAALVLDLEMDRTEDKSEESVDSVYDHIDEHFYFFGGVARFCLVTDSEAKKATLNEIDKTIGRLRSLDQLKGLLGQEESALTSDVLCHYEPTPDMRGYTVAALSKYARRVLVEQLGKVVGKDQLLDTATSFFGWKFPLE